MAKIAGIARYTFTEIFRNKVYYVLLLFAGLLLGSSLLLGEMGGEQRSRMIIDLGLVGMEMFALAIAVFAAVTLVVEEMETRTLYLILTRPVHRYQFILGRFIGLAALMTASLAIMAVLHGLVMLSQKIAPSPWYFLSLLYSWEKIIMVIAVAIFFSLFSTSTVSAVVFTFVFWVLGHLSSEIHFMAEKTHQPVLSLLFKIFFYLAPNFQIINIRDLGSVPSSTALLWGSAGYGLLYTTACLTLASWLFRKKEF